MKKTRVVLADDHTVVRTCIRQILQKAHDIEVVGEASNGNEAIAIVNRFSPDILLLDMEMPVLNGVEVARALHASHSPVRVVALSAYDDQQYVIELLDNGAAGYITKDEAADCVIEAIRKVARGEKGWVSRRAKEALRSR